MSVCVLGDQQHIDEANANGIPCMDVEALKKLNKNKKLIKKLGIVFNFLKILLKHQSKSAFINKQKKLITTLRIEFSLYTKK